MSHLTFTGAARTVTGAKYLLEHRGNRVLVDGGLFQGLKDLRLRNWESLLFGESDAYRAITQLQPFGYDRPFEVVSTGNPSR